MIRLPLIFALLLFSVYALAETITVKNDEELKKANASALPGDIIILQNGEWNNINIKLNCNGTKEQLIVVKAETPGKVIITGQSNLNIGGSFIQIEGLYFSNGFAGKDPVIKFSIDKKEVANYCRVTNTVINDFNNPKRLNENYWVALYGKNNRVDHCSFLNKKNIGVLLAVILEDERSRENFHSIDHNHFGVRLPLASNGGEIIRVGVSEHCQFNSNTQITDNYFDNCDGETEIVSIKSGSNIIRNNLFKECQGSIVLRHGDNNTVENNVFLGNNKEGTGGTRIINKGQWVVNNFYYQCRGEGFRAPLAIMNGVPNSPANRYAPVRDAVIANNTYVDCTPFGLCDGSDTERSVAPLNVHFLNNIVYATNTTQLANIQDDISGFHFSGNLVNKYLTVNVPAGFTNSNFGTQTVSILPVPEGTNSANFTLSDSLKNASLSRVSIPLSQQPGFSDGKQIAAIQENVSKHCGATWFSAKNSQTAFQQVEKDCKNAAEIVTLLAGNKNAQVTIRLTGKKYEFDAPVNISKSTVFTGNQGSVISFSNKQPVEFLFQIVAGNALEFSNIQLDLEGLSVGTLIISDTSASSNHANLKVNDCNIKNLKGSIFTASKTSVFDSVVIYKNNFTNIQGTLLNFDAETDKKGYYNVEKLMISNNTFTRHSGQLLTMLRGGNDESTMGPNLLFSNNKISDCNTTNGDALIYNYGTQATLIENNQFTNSNPGKSIIVYDDAVRSKHLLRNNVMTGSGKVVTDKFVVEEK